MDDCASSVAEGCWQISEGHGRKIASLGRNSNSARRNPLKRSLDFHMSKTTSADKSVATCICVTQEGAPSRLDSPAPTYTRPAIRPFSGRLSTRITLSVSSSCTCEATRVESTLEYWWIRQSLHEACARQCQCHCSLYCNGPCQWVHHARQPIGARSSPMPGIRRVLSPAAILTDDAAPCLRGTRARCTDDKVGHEAAAQTLCSCPTLLG